MSLKNIFTKDRGLIETLWNVKKRAMFMSEWVIIGLIETLWNVKYPERREEEQSRGRFNRNIVECKAL